MARTNKLIAFSLLFLFFVLFFGAHQALMSAQDPGGGGGPVGGGVDGQLVNPVGTTDVVVVLNKVAGYLFTIAAPLAAIMILIGAFQMMFAGGAPEKFATGRRTILYAAIGMAIVLASTGILAVIKELLTA